MSETPGCKRKEGLRRTRQKRNIAIGVAGVLLAGSGALAYKFSSDNEVKPSPSVPAAILRTEQIITDPSLRTVIHRTLGNGSYEQKKVIDVAGSSVHFDAVDGAEFSMQPSLIAEIMNTYHQFATENPNHLISVYDAASSTYRNASITLQTINKDGYMLVFPNSANLGELGASAGEQQKARALTIAAVNYPEDPKLTLIRQSGYTDEDYRAFSVEACQQMIHVRLDNSHDFPKTNRADIEAILQEKVCNTLGDAIAAKSMSGISYQSYLEFVNSIPSMATASSPEYLITFNPVNIASYQVISPTYLPMDVLETTTY